MNGKRPGGWVALAWRYFRDPRFDDVSADAELLWVHALAYAGEQETDGHVARGALVALSHRLTGSPQSAAGELVTVGLWEATSRGWQIHAWDRWQPSVEQAAASRARHAQRMADWRRRGRSTDDITDDATDDITDESVDGSRSTSRDVSRDGASDAVVVAGAGVGRSPTTPAPLLERDDQEPDDLEGEAWEEYTDEHGNLFVRSVANGQADPDHRP